MTPRLLLLILPILALTVAGKFPAGFRFGAATSAFQIEGAWLDEGKAPSVWDNLAHIANYTADDMAPEHGAESYYRYGEDIELMKKAGIKHYRLSISWPRIVPRGRVGSAINQQGVAHYRKMFEAMIAAGITPYVTLFHGDLPILLQIQDYSFVDKDFANNFLYYANICFKSFGDLVKHWFTFNEPWCMAVFEDCKASERSTMPYRIAHSALLTHAKTVKLYREQYKKSQAGDIGLVLNTDMFYPKDKSSASDVAAASRAMDFMLGWFAEPLFRGDYPESMKTTLGSRLPKFTVEEKVLVKGSTDFLAFNHYSSSLCASGTSKNCDNFWCDRNVTLSYRNDWKLTDMGWAIVPEGLRGVLGEIYRKYTKDAKIPIWITENGMANKEPTQKEAENDVERVEYMKGYLENVEKAITEDGVDVRGYFAWSLIDNFEWNSGFTKRFGIVRVEIGDAPKRIPKKSFYWYRDFIAAHSS